MNCFECYRPIWCSDFHYDEKYFCSETCMDRYLSLLRVSTALCRRIAPPAEWPSLRRKGTARKDCGSALSAAAPITNRLKNSFFNGTTPHADLHTLYTYPSAYLPYIHSINGQLDG
jgi:hypothetical protein